MFSNVIKQINIDSILIDRENRQRTDLTFDSILPLAISIGRSQWISPILIDEETNYIIAGERRLMSVKALRAAVNGDYSGFTDQTFAREALSLYCTCKIDSWKEWSKIPAQLGKNFTAADLAMYEFIENAQRQDLPWQDRAKAIYDIHTKGLSQNKEWTAVATANLIGVHRATVTENLRIWRIFADEEVEADLKTIIKESATLRSAAQTVERHTSRREPGLGVSLVSGGTITPRPKAEVSLTNKPGPKPLTDVYKNKTHEEPDWELDNGTIMIYTGSPPVEEEPEVKLTLADKILLNADFNTWAVNYSGEPFNFIHCDFPYGVNFNTGQYISRANNNILGDYDDSSEVYWKLLNTLKDNRHIIAPQAHIMFWFSQNYRRETEDFFRKMGGVVQPFLMIWHCNNAGIVPDPQRYGRRTYETAMLITFGDRKIVAPRALSIEASRENISRVHRSQKPIKVLENFFEMFIDNSSTVLDPTAGSGTGLIIATSLNAKRVVGLELDTGIYEKAHKHITDMEAWVKSRASFTNC